MNKTYYNIDFSGCYESRPCQHHVTITQNTATMFGSPVTTLMYAPDIMDLIIRENISVTYKELLHFSYCFNSPECQKLLEKLKKEYDSIKEGYIVNNDGKKINQLLHKDPQITFGREIYRRTFEHHKMIHACTKIENNVFTYTSQNV